MAEIIKTRYQHENSLVSKPTKCVPGAGFAMHLKFRLELSKREVVAFFRRFRVISSGSMPALSDPISTDMLDP